MKKDLQNIKILINTFIDEELIIDHTQFIYTHIFFEQLEIYFNKNNIKFNKSSVKKQIITSLGLKLGIENYKSSFKNGSRVYTKLKFTSASILNTSTHISLQDYNDLKNEMNILKTNFNQSVSNYLELLTVYKEVLFKLETLENKSLEISKPIGVVEKIKLSNFIITSLNLKQEKDENYPLSDFCFKFIDYSEDSKFILYSATIIEDYICYTGSTINFNTLTKFLKKYIEKTYPNSETKSYNNKNYYKGIIYKNDNFK